MHLGVPLVQEPQVLQRSLMPLRVDEREVTNDRSDVRAVAVAVATAAGSYDLEPQRGADANQCATVGAVVRPEDSAVLMQHVQIEQRGGVA